jgi:hypothetical protein
MNQVTANDVLKDIEFEIAQGVVSRRDLRQALQAVRQFHAKMRREALSASGQSANLRDVASRQFQINDMLITLLQEMAMAVLETQREAHHASHTLQHAIASGLVTTPPTPGTLDEPNESPTWLPPPELEESMKPDVLLPKMEVRPLALPIVGGLIRRVRIALHSLARFYVVRLAQKQAGINRTYGDWILHLTRLSQRQQAEIDALKVRVAALQARHAERR